MTTPTRAGIYCRLSYAPDGSLEKVERQEGDCRQLAARLGWPVADQHIYQDNSRSAWQRNRKRPAWDRMLADVDQGAIDAILVYHGDRLIRQPRDLETLIGIADSKGIRIASVSGTRDLDSPDDRFILRIEAAQACRESDNTSRRVRRGWAARAKKGRPSGGGKRPFGFKDLETIDPAEAAVLAEAADRLLAGQSQGGVIRWMNEVSTTSQGKKWSGAALKKILSSPRVAGLVEHEGVLYEAVWEPIITRDTWEDIKRLFAQNSAERPYYGQARIHMLSGVAECVTCDHTVRTKPVGGRNRKTVRIYHCPNPDCPQRMARNQDHLDAYVTGRTLALLGDPRFAAELADGADTDRPGIGAEISALERRKASAKTQLENLVDYPDLDPAIMIRALESFDRRIAELRGQLATSSSQRLLGRMVGMAREQWDAEPVDVRASVIRILWRIQILPATWRGPGFDPESVRLTRRQVS